LKGVHGQVVKVGDYKPLTLTNVGLNPARNLAFFHEGKLIQLVYKMMVVLLRCSCVPEIMHIGAPVVLKVSVLTYLVLILVSIKITIDCSCKPVSCNRLFLQACFMQ
jgi:hypothetical protein